MHGFSVELPPLKYPFNELDQDFICKLMKTVNFAFEKNQFMIPHGLQEGKLAIYCFWNLVRLLQ